MGVALDALRLVYVLYGVALLVGVGAIAFAGRQDIGAMAEAVEVFRQNAIANARWEQEAAQFRSVQETERAEVQPCTEGEAEQLRLASENLAARLKRLAGGDLAFQITEAFAPGFEPLRHDFNQSVRQLGSALSAIAEGISTMDNGSREIVELTTSDSRCRARISVKPKLTTGGPQPGADACRLIQIKWEQSAEPLVRAPMGRKSRPPNRETPHGQCKGQSGRQGQ